MRKALNENPMVQLGILAVGGIILAVMLMSSLSGGDDEAVPADDPAASEVPAGAAAPAPSAATPAPAVPATPPAADPSAGGTPAPATSAPAGEADSLLPSKGLPEDVLVAYARNKAIALLVVDPKAISDRTVKRYVKRVGSRGNVEAFVVKAKNIAKYSRVTQGVAVSRTPALIVIRPRNKSEQIRTATVSHGFRGGQSIDTALEDALYTGGTRSAAP